MEGVVEGLAVDEGDDDVAPVKMYMFRRFSYLE
jgi:hypothetical protein